MIEHYASLPPLAPFDAHPAESLPLSIPEKNRIEFSFSGLVSATERRVAKMRDEGVNDEAMQREMSRVFQTAIVGHLCRKLGHAIDNLGSRGSGLGGLVVSGGVASNQYLRKQYVPLFLTTNTINVRKKCL